YYPKNNPNFIKKAHLSVSNQSVDQFIYYFPTGLSLNKGEIYEYYFEVFDNDVVNNFKSSKSVVFLHNELTDEQKQDNYFKNQKESINSLEKTLQKQDKQLNTLDKLQKLNKEKSTFDFKDQKKIEDFIKSQQRQDEMMSDFTKRLIDNLENFNPKEQDKAKEDLLKRLEETQKQSEKNEKLLNELDNLQKKLDKEQLFDKADKLKQNAKNQQKNLEQLVELTKRFYVEKKAVQIADKLDKLSKKQEELSKNKDSNLQDQKQVSDDFEKIANEMDQLKQEDNNLKSPLEIPNDNIEKESISNELKQAEENLKDNNSSKASQSQKNASKKMKELSKSLSSTMETNEANQMQEDERALRQILDNLLAFSNHEESLILPTSQALTRSFSVSKILKRQQELKQQFQHIDDSIFAVSLRNPKISDFILNEVGTIHYNMDKSLETISDNDLARGVSFQQFVLTSANRLADF
ncbi:MAG TPA: hypothetical protein DDZ41_11550, partial [Flavobacterium sp.]|nr:hypothetical protein [Flavobacterium sp.]